MNSKNILQLPLSFYPESVPTLENFVAGKNTEAVRVLQEIKDGFGPQFLYLFGPNGSGKTHLVRSICRPSARVPSFSTDQTLYVVEDVDTLDDNELALLFELANQIRAHSGTRLVMTGLKSPAALRADGMRVDVTSRLGWGAVFEIEPLSEKEQQDLFIRRAKAKGLNLTEEVLQWMSVYVPRDMNTLTKLFEELDSYCLSKNRALTIPLIKEWLKKSHQFL